MDTNLQGNIGEAEAVTHYIKEGYSVYLPFGTASKNDMIIQKDNVLLRVSVKTTGVKLESGKYRVKIRQGKLNKQVAFDNKASDLLFVYIIPEDRFVIINSSEVTNGFELTVE